MDADRIAEIFTAFGPIRTRRMFGVTGICAEGVMFALEAYGALYLKADDALAKRLAALGCEPFTYEGKGKPIQMSYWQLPDTALDDPEEAADWPRAALAVVRTARR